VEDRTSVVRRENIIDTGGIMREGFILVFCHWFVTVGVLARYNSIANTSNVPNQGL
jgi:hypothetical protein